jgi:hypothetical protein
MSQYIPQVTDEDIERLISRDFPPETHDEIWQLTASVTVHERLRVIAACLKNANGRIKLLRGELYNADGYWREAISEAEYPKIKKASRYSDAEIHEKQKQQYLKWFNES